MNKTAGKYHAVRRRKMSVIIILAVLLVLSMILALGIGSVFISPTEVLASLLNALFPGLIDAPDGAADIIINFRMPRILLAVLTGIALSAAGAVMQGLLRNPLVSPFTLGLSSAASFGAALMIVLGFSAAGCHLFSRAFHRAFPLPHDPPDIFPPQIQTYGDTSNSHNPNHPRQHSKSAPFTA